MRRGDMLVNLMGLAEGPAPEGARIGRGLICDRERILSFVRERAPGWVPECEKALLQGTLFIAAKDGELLGVSCYDAAALDYFGPILVREDRRGAGIGKALLLRTLAAMREKGYGYAVIGWTGEAAAFYEKCAGAFFIPGGEPENTVYRDLIRFS